MIWLKDCWKQCKAQIKQTNRNILLPVDVFENCWVSGQILQHLIWVYTVCSGLSQYLRLLPICESLLQQWADYEWLILSLFSLRNYLTFHVNCPLMLSMLGKISADDILNYFSNIFFFFFFFFVQENRLSHFMQSISFEISKPIFWEKLEKYHFVICWIFQES